MRERKGFIFNLGTPSMLVILITFVLSVFALLSIRASNSEHTLADKTGDAVCTYYAADEKAERVLVYMDSIIKQVEPEQLEGNLVGLESGNVEEIKGLEQVVVKLEKNASFVTGTEGKAREIGTVSYRIAMEDGSALAVAFALDSDRNYQITKWKVEAKPSDIVDFGGEDLELWDGDVSEGIEE